MLEFICYFMPAFISINIHNNIEKNNKLDKTILYYGIYVTLNNLFSLFIVQIKNINKPFEFGMINVNYCFKYLLISTLISIIMPYLVRIIIRNIEIKVEVKENEKKKSKKKNK